MTAAIPAAAPAPPPKKALIQDAWVLWQSRGGRLRTLAAFLIPVVLLSAWLVPWLVEGLLLDTVGIVAHALVLAAFLMASLRTLLPSPTAENPLVRYVEFLLVVLGVGFIAAFPVLLLLVVGQGIGLSLPPEGALALFAAAALLGVWLLLRFAVALPTLAADGAGDLMDAIHRAWYIGSGQTSGLVLAWLLPVAGLSLLLAAPAFLLAGGPPFGFIGLVSKLLQVAWEFAVAGWTAVALAAAYRRAPLGIFESPLDPFDDEE